jgi:hypothetical protein
MILTMACQWLAIKVQYYLPRMYAPSVGRADLEHSYICRISARSAEDRYLLCDFPCISGTLPGVSGLALLVLPS